MRKGKLGSQAAFNKAVDDLFGDDDDDDNGGVTTRPGSSNVSHSREDIKKKKSSKGGLTSKATDEEFYKNLSALGADTGDDEEDLKLTADDVNKVAEDLGDMDDLESSLFGFGKSTKTPKKVSSTSGRQSGKKKDSGLKAQFDDDDDPLAGLGLSDEENDFGLPSKSKPKKTDTAAKKIPQISSKTKVDQDPSQVGVKPQRSMSMESDDPFLASDPRPRSAGKSGSFQRMNSWEDPSLGTASETELTPRGSGKQSKSGSRKKGKIQPGEVDVSPSASDSKLTQRQSSFDISFDSETDIPGIDEGKTTAEKVRAESKRKKEGGRISPRKNKPGREKRQDEQFKQEKDIFDDDEMLPGLDDGQSPPPKKVAPVDFEPEEPVRKATAALDDLLGGKTTHSETKTRKPTMLDQILSGTSSGGKSKSEGSSVKGASSPERDVTFGTYSPSASSGPQQKRRPTTAPSKRSVRFADELGFGIQNDAGEDYRPSSAPSSKRDKGIKREDPVSTSPPSSPPKGSSGSTRKSTATEETGGSTSPVLGSPRRQNSTASKGKAVSTSSDWLGLGEDLSDDFGLKDNDELFSSRSAKQGNTTTAPAEPISDKGTFFEASEGRSSPVKRGSSPKQSFDDEFAFPWEQPEGSSRRRLGRRQGNSDSSSPLTSDLQKTQEETTNFSKSTASQEKMNTETRASELSEQRQEIRGPLPAPDGVKEPAKGSSSSSTPPVQQNNPQVIPGANLPPQTFSFPPVYLSPSLGIQQSLSPYTAVSVSNTTPQDMLTQAQHPQGISGPASGVSSIPYFGQLQSTPQQPAFDDGTIQALSQEYSSLKLQVEKLALEKRLHEDEVEEVKSRKEHSDKERAALEVEIKSLQKQIRDVGDRKTKQDLDAQATISSLEEKVRKLELEQDQLESSMTALKERHKNEKEASEVSFKSRYQILENSYKHREARLKEDHSLTVSQFQERLAASEAEITEVQFNHKKRFEIFEKNKQAEFEQMKELHKRAIDELSRDYEEQLDHLRQLKEREVQAAISAFSQTKSLHSLIQDVQNSTKEVGFLKERIEKSHHSNLEEREQSLKSRDEYLRNLQERLYKQEAEADRERSRLQGLISRLELQLKEQGRQIEQKEWKINQEENRLKSMQDAFEEEKRMTLEQMNAERSKLDQLREQMISEQKRILTECYEERRKILTERMQPVRVAADSKQAGFGASVTDLKQVMDSELASLRSRLNEEASQSKGIQSDIIAEREKLSKERQELTEEKFILKEGKMKVELFVKSLEEKAKDIQLLSQEATNVHNEGKKAFQDAQMMRAELNDQAVLLEARKTALDAKEQRLTEEKAVLADQKRRFETDRRSMRIVCRQCGGTVSSKEESGTDDSVLPSADESSKQPLITGIPAVSHGIGVPTRSQAQVLPSPPDVILSSLEFRRSLRRWSDVKAKDDEFLEEESRFLENLQRKRAHKLGR